MKKWDLKDGSHSFIDMLYGSTKILKVTNGIGKARIDIKPLESFIYRLE